MTKVTVISHFYNEEYLLPFWIEHHKKIFDHGILINHGSNDKSVEIIKKLAPTWDVIESPLDTFDPYYTDFEVQTIESTIDGWKICLNTTEFLVGKLHDTLRALEAEGVSSVHTSAKIMVDLFPSEIPSSNALLVDQKPYGFFDNKLYDTCIRGPIVKKILKLLLAPRSRFIGRQRLLHKEKIGQYRVGRHEWGLNSRLEPTLSVYWYAYSPWNKNFIDRKLGIASTMPNTNDGLGAHHRYTLRQLNNQFRINKFWLKIARTFRMLIK